VRRAPGRNGGGDEAHDQGADELQRNRLVGDEKAAQERSDELRECPRGRKRDQDPEHATHERDAERFRGDQKRDEAVGEAMVFAMTAMMMTITT